jgi:hypothetical protein
MPLRIKGEFRPHAEKLLGGVAWDSEWHARDFKG